MRNGKSTATFYEGIPINAVESETTRYLSASAVLNYGWFRRLILTHAGEKHKAFAPERGLDLQFLAKICKYLERRETKYNVAFFFISVAFVLLQMTFSIAEETFVKIALPLFSLAWLIRFIKGQVEHSWLTTLFPRDKYDPEAILKEFNIRTDAPINSMLNPDEQNLVVYSGFKPFVGAGIELSGWSFTVDLSRSKEDLGIPLEVMPFRLKELYDKIDLSLKETRLAGLKTQDVLFVNGSDIRNEKWILPYIYDQPVRFVDIEAMNRFINTNDSRIRHYKWMQVYDWGNELVMSYFFRCSRRGKNLFAEVNVFLLTPMAEQFRAIDRIIPHDWRGMLLAVLKSLLSTPFRITFSGFTLFAKFSAWLKDVFDLEERRIRKLIKYNPLFDYGATQSLREITSSQQYFHYFQKIDKEMYVKVLEQNLLDAIVKFLDEHNIDTSDLKQRQTTILNNGILVQRGNVNAGAMAVGTGAQAISGGVGDKANFMTKLKGTVTNFIK